ncbi:hypothetical protein F5B18DRAFT_672133 [Nemania serpens]|nr:hypothetical protein F5B18DRAFT_672133 [Nemania serpens]
MADQASHTAHLTIRLRRWLYKRPGYMAIATSLPKFPQLPAELRLMIWEEFMRYPRVVPLAWRARRRPRPGIKIDGITRQAVPPLLLVNCESRSVAMKSLLVFSFQLPNPDRYVHMAMSSYDILLFDDVLRTREAKAKGDSHKISNLMVVSNNRPDDREDYNPSAGHVPHIWHVTASRAIVAFKLLGNENSLETLYCMLNEEGYGHRFRDPGEHDRVSEMEMAPSLLENLLQFPPSHILPSVQNSIVHPEVPRSIEQVWERLDRNRSGLGEICPKLSQLKDGLIMVAYFGYFERYEERYGPLFSKSVGYPSR